MLPTWPAHGQAALDAIREAVTQFCVLHRVASEDCDNLEDHALGAVQEQQANTSTTACSRRLDAQRRVYSSSSSQQLHPAAIVAGVSITSMHQGSRGRHWWRPRPLAEAPDCTIAIVMLRPDLPFAGLAFDDRGNAAADPVPLQRQHLVNWIADVMLQNALAQCELEIVAPVDDLEELPWRWPSPAHASQHGRARRVPSLVILATDVALKPKVQEVGPGRMPMVAALTHLAARFTAAGVPRLGLLLLGDEFGAIQSDAYACFDFVIRQFWWQGHRPLHHQHPRCSERESQARNVIAEARQWWQGNSSSSSSSAPQAAAMASSCEGSGRPHQRKFGEWHASQLHYLPLGPNVDYFPSHARRWLPRPSCAWNHDHAGATTTASPPRDCGELLLGPPKPASQRRYLITFVGNKHPAIASSHWVGYARMERAHGIDAIDTLRRLPPLPGYDDSCCCCCCCCI